MYDDLLVLNEVLVGNQYEHPDGLYVVTVKKDQVTVSFKTRPIFDEFRNSRQFAKLQDLVDVTTNRNHVHVHSKSFAIAGIDAVPRRGHIVWLRALNRFYLKPPVERRVRKSRTIAVKYDQAGAAVAVVETTARKVKVPPRRKPVAAGPKPVEKSKLDLLVDRFRRSA